jgi:1-deoxy-D-xylulose-5-phosphate reductoisomerase
MTDDITNLAILGSTGSIGQQTLDIIRNYRRQFRVVCLAAGNNTALLQKQAEEFGPRYVYSSGKINLANGIKSLSMEDMASLPEVDMVVVATSGKAGLNPVIAAIRAHKKIAIANKEPLVMAGEIVMAEAKKHNVQVRPVDSEHSAIWQCLAGEKSAPAKLMITASGGPFYGFNKNALEKVTAAQALNHPTWKMGKKVTVDSATLMNKGLEVIEAHWLFDVPFEKIEVLVHPQSLVHSLVEFADGSIKAQVSPPDMHLPIQYALTWPGRLSSNLANALDLAKLGQLVFKPVDYESYPCLQLALAAGKTGGTLPAVLCAADEIAVGLFLEGRIKFTGIAPIIKATMEAHHVKEHPSLAEIIDADEWARLKSIEIAGKGSLCY